MLESRLKHFWSTIEAHLKHFGSMFQELCTKHLTFNDEYMFGSNLNHIFMEHVPKTFSMTVLNFLTSTQQRKNALAIAVMASLPFNFHI
jgi:hypothetical protein